MAVCLVTGGAGFIGSHLVEALVARGEHVRVLDNFSTGELSNLATVRNEIELIFGDLSDLPTAREAVRGVELVFHLAASPIWRHGFAAPRDSDANSAETLNLLSAAQEADVKRFIFASSACVYGVATPFPVSESYQPRPLSVYAASKWAAEKQCQTYSELYGLETVRLRYFGVFGTRQPSSSPYGGLLAHLKAMLLGKSPVIHGDGHEPQDWLSVDDVVHANLLALEAPRVAGKVYNIGRGRPSTPLEIVATINKILGTKIQPIEADSGLQSEMCSVANISRAEAELGFCPGTDLEHGLRKWIASFSRWRADLASLERARKESQWVYTPESS
jgi:UDP-glucose 4-epimerase